MILGLESEFAILTQVKLFYCADSTHDDHLVALIDAHLLVLRSPLLLVQIDLLLDYLFILDFSQCEGPNDPLTLVRLQPLIGPCIENRDDIPVSHKHES